MLKETKRGFSLLEVKVDVSRDYWFCVLWESIKHSQLLNLHPPLL